MVIREIELQDFRNYKNLRVSFSDGINIFLGENAQGKTNLLEGIYLNAMAKSFKTIREKEMIRFGEDYSRIITRACYGDDEHTVEIIISREGAKAITIDGVKIRKTSELLDKLHIIVFSPEDLKIVKDEPTKRRNFIDREICQIRPRYVSDMNHYRRALKQRNACLKEENKDEHVLDIWDRELVQYGSRVVRMRKEFIQKIGIISQDIHHRISGGRENLEIQYETEISGGGSEEEIFYDMLKREREKDMHYGSTGRGPHRDDLKICADGTNLRCFGSQGQQRTAALSLKLSEIRIIEEETGEKPILLLDDVLSELDNERQKYLINSLEENQMFITTTDLIGSVARSLPKGKIFTIKNGEIDIEI
ncbi:MAG: DNA replication/repair protein RecF [Bacillota bacterium]|nr:DNA replication/repair protein RecF [Bacillota bacterium]